MGFFEPPAARPLPVVSRLPNPCAPTRRCFHLGSYQSVRAAATCFECRRALVRLLHARTYSGWRHFFTVLGIGLNVLVTFLNVLDSSLNVVGNFLKVHFNDVWRCFFYLDRKHQSVTHPYCKALAVIASTDIAWRLAIRSFVDGAAVSTAGYVKLLLPPRQSRGNSHWGLGSAVRRAGTRSAQSVRMGCPAWLCLNMPRVARLRMVEGGPLLARSRRNAFAQCRRWASKRRARSCESRARLSSEAATSGWSGPNAFSLIANDRLNSVSALSYRCRSS